MIKFTVEVFPDAEQLKGQFLDQTNLKAAAQAFYLVVHWVDCKLVVFKNKQMNVFLSYLL